MTERSKASVSGHWLDGIAGSSPAGFMVVSYECSVLSGRGLCDWPISCLEE